MRLLLDTCSFLWAVQGQEQLSKTARQAILDSHNEIIVSAISFWEIAIKFRLGKLMLRNVVPSEFPRIALELGCTLLPLSAEDAASYSSLPMVEGHRDPFDRMLVCITLSQRFTLISRDRAMSDYEKHGLSLLW